MLCDCTQYIWTQGNPTILLVYVRNCIWRHIPGYVKMEAQYSIKHILRRTYSKITQILNVLEIFSWYAMNYGNVKFQILNHGYELNFGIALPPQFTCWSLSVAVPVDGASVEVISVALSHKDAALIWQESPAYKRHQRVHSLCTQAPERGHMRT